MNTTSEELVGGRAEATLFPFNVTKMQWFIQRYYGYEENKENSE